MTDGETEAISTSFTLTEVNSAYSTSSSSLRALRHDLHSTIARDLQLYRNFTKHNDLIEKEISVAAYKANPLDQVSQNNELNANTNNKINRCNTCKKNEAERFHSCKECLDGYGLKEIDDCRRAEHRKTLKCYDRTIYATNRDPRCKRIKYRYCKCKVTASFGLCLSGFLLVVIGTGVFGGCWVYLAYASINICKRSTYLHFFWYYIYAVTIFMFIFTIVVIILMANSSSRHSVCSIINNPGTGKNCSIIVLFMIVVQSFIWMFLFTVVFYIGTEIYLMKNDSRALCGVIDMTLNYTNLFIAQDYFSTKTMGIIFASALGAVTVVIGLMLIIIGVSMNYQKMKSAISDQRDPSKCRT